MIYSSSIDRSNYSYLTNEEFIQEMIQYHLINDLNEFNFFYHKEYSKADYPHLEDLQFLQLFDCYFKDLEDEYFRNRVGSLSQLEATVNKYIKKISESTTVSNVIDCNFNTSNIHQTCRSGYESGLNLGFLENVFFDCSRVSSINWRMSTCNATCITFYGRYNRGIQCSYGQLASGDTYCYSEENIYCNGCATRHANLFCQVYGRCPQAGDNLIISGGYIVNNVYTGHSNTFNDGSSAWNYLPAYSGVSQQQNTVELMDIASKMTYYTMKTLSQYPVYGYECI